MKTIISNITKSMLAVLLFLSFSVYADGKEDSASAKVKSSTTAITQMTEIYCVSPVLMSPAKVMICMAVESEPELEVLDLEMTKALRPLWSIEASEQEMKVEDYKPTTEIIPFWMIVKPESELLVTDLVL